MALVSPAEKEGTEPPTHKVTHDSMCATTTYDGKLIRWYVMADLDYRIQYLVNDRGGCCVRLDSDGNVMGAGLVGTFVVAVRVLTRALAWLAAATQG